ncbi:MAG: Nicotinate-nucleotide adenylyltransferase [Gammaproteobacteria bacterium]|nr:Nicotinate-nucleotide adenylyltransferase [Gammaproteobacteria bacterium]
MTTPIGLLGGTFDPVHNGHLAIAKYLCTGLNMQHVRFVLNASPPHRTLPACSVEHRLAMLEAVLADEDLLIPDIRELGRRGPSYTVWTLRSLRREFSDQPLCWIVGIDAWFGVRSWYRWYELSSLTHLLVVKRPGWELAGRQISRASPNTKNLKRRAAGSVVLCDGPEVDVSASDIRHRIACRQDISSLAPEPVRNYIERKQLYGYRQSVT